MVSCFQNRYPLLHLWILWSRSTSWFLLWGGEEWLHCNQERCLRLTLIHPRGWKDSRLIDCWDICSIWGWFIWFAWSDLHLPLHRWVWTSHTLLSTRNRWRRWWYRQRNPFDTIPWKWCENLSGNWDYTSLAWIAFWALHVSWRSVP